MHSHDHDRDFNAGKRLAWTIVLNILITIVEVIGGFFASSLSLLSDALHNLSDVFAVLISYFGYRLSQIETTEKRTFGLRRAEVFAALINSVILGFLSFFLFKEAFLRLSRPHPIKEEVVFVVGAIGLAGNLASMYLLFDKHRRSLNVYSAFLHMFADALSSVGVVAGAIIIRLTGFYLIDSLLGFAIGSYVLYESFKLLKESAGILMQVAPKNIDVQEVKREVEKIDGVSNVHHVHLWALTDREIFFEAHVELSEDIKVSEACKKIKAIESVLKERFGISHTTIQVEFKACTDKSLIKGSGGAKKLRKDV